MQHNTTLNRVATARHAACNAWPYAATAILSLTPIETRMVTATAAVDARWRLYVNPDTLAEWDDPKLKFVILHEVSHLLLRHHARARTVLGEKPTQQHLNLWNIAADIAIHTMFTTDGIKIPDDAMQAKMFEFDEGLSVEEYYSLLLRLPKNKSPDGQPSQPSGDGHTDKGGSSADGQQRDWEHSLDPTPLSKAGTKDDDGKNNNGDLPDAANKPIPGQQEASTDKADTSNDKPNAGDIDNTKVPEGLDEHDADVIRQDVAAKAQNGRGSMAGRMSKIADHLKEPKLDPKTLLRIAIARNVARRRSGHGTASYHRPSRRPQIGNCIRANAMAPEPNMCILVDTSGSMCSDDIALSLGLIAKCLRSLSYSEGIRVVTGDTRNAKDCQITKASQVECIGGGGTDMGKIITDIAEGKNKPDIIICATDGITPWPEKKLRPTVIAAITRDEPHQYYPVPKWIKTVYLK